MFYHLFFITLHLATVLSGTSDNSISECNLSEDLINEIASYAPVVDKIISALTKGDFKHRTYDELGTFVETFGPRPAGSLSLNKSIDYMVEKLEKYNLDNVHLEEVPDIPHWIRKNEYAELLEPIQKKLEILGLGSTIATPEGGITAEVLLVKSFDELTQKADLAKGKIIIFNPDWVSYGETVQYRTIGAVAAAKVGGLASLVKSVTPFSLYTPHTGWQEYSEEVSKIPTASITVEDANLIENIQKRGISVKIHLNIESGIIDTITSYNTVAEIAGASKPEKIVIVSGHLDSWDVGVGAMDDGGGAFISWVALGLLKSLNLQPKRTLRAVLWTAEEVGYNGAIQYKKAHADEEDNFIFLLESDDGTFTPLGFVHNTGTQGTCILGEIVKLLGAINATQLVYSPSIGSDITLWTSNGFPGGSVLTKDERYFWYHHTNADTLDVEDPDDLDKNTALWASVAYILADLSIDFPRETRK